MMLIRAMARVLGLAALGGVMMLILSTMMTEDRVSEAQNSCYYVQQPNGRWTRVCPQQLRFPQMQIRQMQYAPAASAAPVQLPAIPAQGQPLAKLSDLDKPAEAASASDASTPSAPVPAPPAPVAQAAAPSYANSSYASSGSSPVQGYNSSGSTYSSSSYGSSGSAVVTYAAPALAIGCSNPGCSCVNCACVNCNCQSVSNAVASLPLSSMGCASCGPATSMYGVNYTSQSYGPGGYSQSMMVSSGPVSTGFFGRIRGTFRGLFRCR